MAKARNVRPTRRYRKPDKPSPRRSRGAGLIFAALLFLAAIGAAVWMNKLPRIVLMIYLTASVIAFFTYAWDKSAAQNDRRRTPEANLHLLGLAGGWPGALIAQQWLRHKSSKIEFLRVYWATVLINCLAFGYFVSTRH
jgi:uncharacterized membrane protein YsdA (DUF1294 family)